MKHHRIDPAMVRDDGNWEVFETGPSFRRSRLWLDEERYIVRTEYLGEAELLEDNRRALDASAGKRFGDGRVVARIPLNRFYQSEIADKVKEGDRDFLKWFLNRDEARPFRTFRGRI